MSDTGSDVDARIAQAVAVQADRLDLRGLGLKTLPPIPAALRDLTALELGSNRLKELPEALGELRHLRRLGLGNNRLSDLPAGFAELSQLASLDLSENRFTQMPPVIAQLTRLEELSLYANRLTEVPAALLALRSLERLDLSTNRLQALPRLEDGRFSRLQALDLSRNELAAVSEVGQLRALRVLNVANNQLSSLAGLEGLALLEELDVSHNQLISLPPALRRGGRLRRLDTSGNPLAYSADGEGVDAYVALREKASAALGPLISGGSSVAGPSDEGPSDDGAPSGGAPAGGGVRYFDAVPFTFNFDLTVDHGAAASLIDLYYKKIGGDDVSLVLADGGVLDLSSTTRTGALSIAHTDAPAPQPLRVRLGASRSEPEMQAKKAFVVDALTQIPGSGLTAPTGQFQFSAGDPPAQSIMLQWSRPRRSAEPTERTIGVGFAPLDDPDSQISDAESLPCDRWTWLWCTVGAGDRVSGAIGGGQALSAAVLEHADLDVALFANPQGFQLENPTGTLRLAGAGCSVLRPAAIPERLSAERVSSHLYFRVKTPQHGGRQQLRVHLYHHGLLVQALDVAAWIGPDNPDPLALSIKTDYVLSRALDPHQLRGLGEHTLSLFVNESPDAMSGFRFFGQDGAIAASASIETGKIGTLLETARRAFRQVSWGNETAYDPDRDSYRYDPQGVAPDLKQDLVLLAKCGFQLWDGLAKSLSRTGDVNALQEAMRRPGIVQLGLKESSTQLLPLSILYDRPIDPTLKNPSAFTICPEYAKGPGCFDGNCPNSGNLRVVCPSGFWGFRHSIGVPIGSAAAPDTPGRIAASPVRVVASAYAGDFPLRDDHLTRLETLIGPGCFEKDLTCEGTVKRMRQGGFQVLYFYCHGGVEGQIPYVLVGTDEEDPNQIVRATLRANDIEWKAPHSLVFINGCHTTALEPEQAIDLVNGFVETAQASGVIGTEVTVFEPLATKMGEAFFQRLLAGAAVGTALRDARRALLLADRPNPLGLVYIPFALSTLTLEDPPTPAPHP